MEDAGIYFNIEQCVVKIDFTYFLSTCIQYIANSHFYLLSTQRLGRHDIDIQKTILGPGNSSSHQKHMVVANIDNLQILLSHALITHPARQFFTLQDA